VIEPASRQSRPWLTNASEVVTIAQAFGAGFLLLILYLIFTSFFPGAETYNVLAAFATGSTLLITLVRPRWMFYGFIALCMVIPNEMEEYSIPLGFMKIYPQDALLVFAALLVCLRKLFGEGSLHQLPFNRLMLVYLALGIWATGVGLFVTGNPYDSLLGDFRRSFFYFSTYFFALALIDKSSEIRFLKLALLTGSVMVILRGLLQAIAGDFVTRRFGDAAHIMNHFEVTFSTFAVYYGLAHLTVTGRSSWWWITVVLAGILVVVLGNFRTCWIGFITGLCISTILLPRRQRLHLAGAGFAVALFATALLALLWQVPVADNQSTIGENIMQKADWKVASTDTNVSWRIDSYHNALGLWQTQPFIGRGLGEQLEFYTATSTGKSMLATGHRVHNSYIWLLMSLGLSGFAVFIYVHWRFAVTVTAALRKPQLPLRSRITLTASLSFYGAIMASALFDVYLESSPPITIISVIMAICLLTIRYLPHQIPCCEAPG
jgi:hypothetical protein